MISTISNGNITVRVVPHARANYPLKFSILLCERKGARQTHKLINEWSLKNCFVYAFAEHKIIRSEDYDFGIRTILK